MQDRVLADNPLDEETELPLGEIVPAEWRVVRLEHTEPNGTRHIIERGVPLDEINGNALLVVEHLDRVAGELDVSSDSVAELTLEPIRVGQTIFIDLPEHGISADFLVKEIRSCPTPNSGDGCLVTTKFIHENAEILDLWIEGSADVIGTTASHPFWSEDRQQFVAAGDLRVGEHLRLADDTTRNLESLTRRETRETVYNIEVDGEHVFYVGNDGVLVHNTCNTVVLSQNMPWRVGPAARSLSARTISVMNALTWTVGKNSSWIGRIISNVTKKRGPIRRIFDIGDEAGGVPVSGRGFYANEVRILLAQLPQLRLEHGWVQVPTNLTVTINGVVTPVFEWIRP